jgi:hypothetical protein
MREFLKNKRPNISTKLKNHLNRGGFLKIILNQLIIYQ